MVDAQVRYTENPKFKIAEFTTGSGYVGRPVILSLETESCAEVGGGIISKTAAIERKLFGPKSKTLEIARLVLNPDNWVLSVYKREDVQGMLDLAKKISAGFSGQLINVEYNPDSMPYYMLMPSRR